MTDVYYKILTSDGGELTAVCLQDFDEADHKKSNWLCDTKFESEDDAQEVINGIYKFVGRYIR